MALTIKHAFTNPKADGPDATVVRPSDWNADHVVTGASDPAGPANAVQFNAAGVSAGNAAFRFDPVWGAVHIGAVDESILDPALSATLDGPATVLSAVSTGDGDGYLQINLIQIGGFSGPEYSVYRANGTADALADISDNEILYAMDLLGYIGDEWQYLASQIWTYFTGYVRLLFSGGLGTPFEVALNGNVGFSPITGGIEVNAGVPVSAGGALALLAASSLVTAPVTVATLPAAPTMGMRAFVSDSNAADITAAFGTIVAGGGAQPAPVWYDGAAWRIG